MIGLLVCGHGHFASGITSALELIMGAQQDYDAIDFPLGSSKDELERQIDAVLARYSEGDSVIIFDDLLSGTPFNIAMERVVRDPGRIHLLYGVNLGMLIEAVNMRSMGESVEAIEETALEIGRSQVGRFTPESLDMDEEDEGEEEEEL